MENNKNEEIVEIKKQKEEADKLMLKLEWAIGLISGITFLVLVFVASYIEMSLLIRSILMIFGTAVLAIGVISALKIEQVAGYYKCKKCEQKYIPYYKSVFFAMHIGRTRYMKCPKCNKRSWNKKVLAK